MRHWHHIAVFITFSRSCQKKEAKTEQAFVVQNTRDVSDDSYLASNDTLGPYSYATNPSSSPPLPSTPHPSAPHLVPIYSEIPEPAPENVDEGIYLDIPHYDVMEQASGTPKTPPRDALPLDSACDVTAKHYLQPNASYGMSMQVQRTGPKPHPEYLEIIGDDQETVEEKEKKNDEKQTVATNDVTDVEFVVNSVYEPEIRQPETENGDASC